MMLWHADGTDIDQMILALSTYMVSLFGIKAPAFFAVMAPLIDPATKYFHAAHFTLGSWKNEATR